MILMDCKINYIFGEHSIKIRDSVLAFRLRSLINTQIFKRTHAESPHQAVTLPRRTRNKQVYVEIYLSISDEIIPNELIPRFHSSEWLMGYVLFAAFITLAIARFARAGIYQTLVLANGKFQGVVSFVRETMPLAKPSSLLLLLNYVLSAGAICYLYVQGNDEIHLANNALVFILPAALLVWNLACLILTRWLSGAPDVFSGPITFKIIGTLVLGLIYFLCAVLWLFIGEQGVLFAQLALFLFFAETGFRVVKSINLVLRQGVSWYYIILYLCTLEILPLLMIYFTLGKNFY